MRLVLVGLLLATSGVGWVRAAGSFEPPRLTRSVEPVYPPSLKEAGVEGQVEAEFEVNRRGEVVDPQVTFSTHPEFAEAVRKVVSKWRFAPARQDGLPVVRRVRMPVLFAMHADDPLSTWAGRSVFRQLPQEPVQADELEEWPEPVAWIEPYYPEELDGTGKVEEIVVSFTIDEHGDVVNPEVVVGEDPHFILSALAATVSLQFSPHMTDDGPVPVAMAVAYRFDERKQQQWEEVGRRLSEKKRR